eukprot:1334542-Amphidinium_carterae.1
MFGVSLVSELQNPPRVSECQCCKHPGLEETPATRKSSNRVTLTASLVVDFDGLTLTLSELVSGT